MNTAKKIEIWGEISRILREYELSQIEAVKAEIAKSYDGLRQRLTVLSLESEMPENDDAG